MAPTDIMATAIVNLTPPVRLETNGGVLGSWRESGGLTLSTKGAGETQKAVKGRADTIKMSLGGASGEGYVRPRLRGDTHR